MKTKVVFIILVIILCVAASNYCMAEETKAKPSLNSVDAIIKETPARSVSDIAKMNDAAKDLVEMKNSMIETVNSDGKTVLTINVGPEGMVIDKEIKADEIIINGEGTVTFNTSLKIGDPDLLNEIQDKGSLQAGSNIQIGVSPVVITPVDTIKIPDTGKDIFGGGSTITVTETVQTQDVKKDVIKSKLPLLNLAPNKPLIPVLSEPRIIQADRRPDVLRGLPDRVEDPTAKPYYVGNGATLIVQTTVTEEKVDE